jgi:hypothetical protein
MTKSAFPKSLERICQLNCGGRIEVVRHEGEQHLLASAPRWQSKEAQLQIILSSPAMKTSGCSNLIREVLSL